MAFIDGSINSPKLALSSEPWSPEDPSFKNRAQLSPYVDSLNCGFSVFLKHPSELGKKITLRNGKSMDLSSMPIQARMDRIQFTIVMRSLKRLASDKEYKGITIDLMNYWYDAAGEVVLTNGKKVPCHTATVKTGRDENGVIFIGIKEEKHPEKEARPGAKFLFKSNTWYKIKNNNNDTEYNAVEDSIEVTLSYVENWKDAVLKNLDKNYSEYIKEKAIRQEKRRQQFQNGNSQQNTKPQSEDAVWS